MINFSREIEKTEEHFKQVKTFYNDKTNEEVVEIIQNSISEYEINQAMNQLVKNNIGLVKQYAYKASNNIWVAPEYGGDDILFEGIRILCEAAYTFDLGRGRKFASYIGKKIFGGIIDYLAGELFEDVSSKTAQKYCKAVHIYNDCLYKKITDMETIHQTIKEKLKLAKLSTAEKYLEEGLKKIHEEQLTDHETIERIAVEPFGDEVQTVARICKIA